MELSATEAREDMFCALWDICSRTDFHDLEWRGEMAFILLVGIMLMPKSWEKLADEKPPDAMQRPMLSSQVDARMRMRLDLFSSKELTRKSEKTSAQSTPKVSGCSMWKNFQVIHPCSESQFQLLKGIYKCIEY
jgi:hypothetical protein